MSAASSNILRRIAALKLHPEAMAEVLSIIADVQAIEEQRREKQRTRKQQQRHRDSHGTVTGQRRDRPRATEAVADRSGGDPQAVAPSVAAADTSARAENTTKRKVPPHPPKEKQLPLQELLKLESDEREVVTEFARAREKAGSRLPDNWQPSIADLEFAATLLAADRVTIEADKFRDHFRARAGPNAVKRDWSATWRNWCRKALEMNGGHGAKSRNGGHEGAGLGFSGLAAHLRAKRTGNSV